MADERDASTATAPSSLLQAWERAVPLMSAADTHLPHAADTTGQLGVDVILAELGAGPAGPLEDRPAALRRLQSLADAWQRQMDILQSRREQLVGHLAVGTLTAVGFEKQRSPSERLMRIPPLLWSSGATIDWEGSRLQSGGYQFVDVRVLGPPFTATISSPAST